jgi:hypothetical protein
MKTNDVAIKLLKKRRLGQMSVFIKHLYCFQFHNVVFLAQITFYVPQQTHVHVEETQLVLVLIYVTELAAVSANIN